MRSGPSRVGERREIDLERIAGDHRRAGRDNALAISASAARQRSSRSMAMTCARAFGEQRAREPAGSRTDFDDGDAAQRPRGARDPAGEVEVEQEILAERFLRRQFMAADDIAQRRQIVEDRVTRVASAALPRVRQRQAARQAAAPR